MQRGNYLQLYGSAISSPSNNLGVATFHNIGLFDLPDKAIFQVFSICQILCNLILQQFFEVVFDSILGCICVFSRRIYSRLEQQFESPCEKCVNRSALCNFDNIFMLSASDVPFYISSNVISSCTIIKKPQTALAENSFFKEDKHPFEVQVSHKDLTPYPYKVASAHIVVRQNGVVLEGAASVVDPYTGTAKFDRFKLVRANNLPYINYQIVSNGVVCTEQTSTASNLLLSSEISIRIATIPATIELVGGGAAKAQVFVGVESALVLFHIYDSNFANADQGVATIKVLLCAFGVNALHGYCYFLFDFNHLTRALNRPQTLHCL